MNIPFTVAGVTKNPGMYGYGDYEDIQCIIVLMFLSLQ